MTIGMQKTREIFENWLLTCKMQMFMRLVIAPIC